MAARILIVEDEALSKADPEPSGGDPAPSSVASLDLPQSGIDLKELLSQVEDRLIDQALERTGGNKNRAAELLGLNRTTLVEKLKRRSAA